MGLSRSGTLFLIGLLALIGLSLHPVAGVEAFVDALFAPSRVLSELALPFRFLGASSVRAAQEQSEAALSAERERSRAMMLASQAAAIPTEVALLKERALVSAHVIGREDKMRDRLRLRYPVDAGVAPGMPVVCGDVFVGRVSALDPLHPGECTADLVTTKSFRVGAVVVGGSVAGGSVAGEKALARFVVGGILGDDRDPARGLRLLAQYPSDRACTSGELRVSEDAASPEARLADGFRLGSLEAVDLRGVALLGVRPLVDYGSGLNAVAIVCPPQMATAGPVLALDPFDDAAWIHARVLLAGDASPLRTTRKLALGASSGVRRGAALAIGARFIGRVESVRAWSVDARLLADSGTAFHCMAKVAGSDVPVILGRVVSHGADGRGADGACFVWLEWPAAIPMDAADGPALAAELWTAAGEADVPPGLLVGTTELPRGRGPFRLRVQLAQDPAGALSVKVWRGRDALAAEPP